MWRSPALLRVALLARPHILHRPTSRNTCTVSARPAMSTDGEEFVISVCAKDEEALERVKAGVRTVNMPAMPFNLGHLTAAKGTGSSSSVVLQYPDSPEGSTATFQPTPYFQGLHTRLLGTVLLTAAELPSTQTLLQDNPGLLPDGTVCVADRQGRGKGRGQNNWESPAGCLMFSALTHLSIPGQRLPFVQYVVSLALVQAIQEHAGERLQGGHVDIRIKWPNDVYGAGLKLGGVLCQSAYREGRFQVVVGVGLNLSNRQPTTCVDALVEEQRRQLGLPGAAAAVQPEALLASTLNHLEGLLDTLLREGFQPLQAAYLGAWLHSGQQVVLEEGQGAAQVRVPLTITGLTPSGYLCAMDDRGEQYELHPDGNSLDFFKGLVRKKTTS